MDLAWTHEAAARWDADKARLVAESPGAIPEGHTRFAEGDLLPGQWWRLTADGNAIAYGWMDTTWGDAEVVLLLASDTRGQGLGSFVLSRLEFEAKAVGVNYLYNAIPSTHPDPDGLRRWLEKRGFKASEDGRLLRARIRTPAPP